MIHFIMRIEKRVTRNTRRINAAQRQVELLREEVNSLSDDVDEMRRRFDILWTAIRGNTLTIREDDS